MRFQTLLERISNPLRKQSLVGTPTNLQEYKDYVANFQDYVVYDDHEDEPELQEIKRKYLNMYKMFPARADAWLNKVGEQRGRDLFLKSKLEPTFKKVYEYKGVQVFIDADNVDASKYVEGSYNHRIIKRCVDLLFLEVRDLMPVKRPKFIITNNAKHKTYPGTWHGIYWDKMIFLDENQFDDYTLWVHEFAHYMADTIPSQTVELLRKAYSQLLDIYWKSAKKKKRSVEDDDSPEAKQLRYKIALKLGFPEYGLTNPDEFFAVLIQFWKRMPNNTATYKYKTLVKNILSRLA